jgi:hypothetical protein
MTFEQFAYWLQGFAESHPEHLTPAQWEIVKEHLGAVFTKTTKPVLIPQFSINPKYLAQDQAAPNETDKGE